MLTPNCGKFAEPKCKQMSPAAGSYSHVKPITRYAQTCIISPKSEDATDSSCFPEDSESATMGGHGPSQDSLSQEENPEPMEDERSEEKGDMEVLEGCKGSSNGAQDHEAPEPFSSPVSEKENHLQGVAGHYLFKCLINVKKEMDQSSIMRSIMTFKGEDVGSYHYFEANEAFANTLDPFANPADLTH
ncbi:hypothetical protein MG293_007949 [Ovis ammon polii]|uniref:Uncharacterized protein n=1 Tax=Ovis ammon polii TaxID=230172 RepID=A0AAD4UFE1_OVIAM|nr:hypothetical protein MG293_007949 [Ovis ammon polii]